MKCIFDGGYNKTDPNSVSNSIFVRYGDFLLEELKKGKKLLIATNAKPVGHYSERIEPFFREGADMIDKNTNEVDWGKYDTILVLGGNNQTCVNELTRLDFNVNKLKKDVLYIGCSVGTMIMSPYLCDYDQEKKEVNFLKGFLPSNNEIYLVHANNPWYVDDFHRNSIEKFAKENNLVVVPINENEVIERDFLIQ